jgi:ParB/RepB/Spo0J family partition protein
MATKSKQQVQAFSHIKLSQLVPSSTNPRKTFGKDDMKELVSSVKQHGIIQPLTVRMKGKKYEIIAGHRRFEAAKKVGLASVPTIIRETSDEEMIAVQLVENLQRADIPPLEEAESYVALLQAGKSMQEIALLTGRPVAYVTRRTKLDDLIDLAKKDLRAGKLPVAYALEICRIDDPGSQRKIFDEWKDDRISSVGQLRNMIARHTQGDLKTINFSLDDAVLYPEAGACTTCQFNTATKAVLFEDLASKDPRCLNVSCLDSKKRRAYIRAADEYKAKGGMAWSPGESDTNLPKHQIGGTFESGSSTYVFVSSKDHIGGKYQSYHEAFKKHLKPIMVWNGKGEGTEYIYNMGDLQKTAKEHGIKLSRPSSGMSAREKEQRLEQKFNRKVLDEVATRFVKAIEEAPISLDEHMDLVLDRAIQRCYGPNLQSINRRRGWTKVEGEYSASQVTRRYGKELDGNGKTALILEIMFINDAIPKEKNDEFYVVMDMAGINPDAVRAELEAERDAKK